MDTGDMSGVRGAQDIPANPVINKNKVGPPATDNILHNYANYTYKISLLAWNSYKDYNLDILHADWESMHDRDLKNKKVLFSSGGVPNERRHPSFDKDFYISTFTCTAVLGQNFATRGSNVFNASMGVIEPVGTTLLERFQDVLMEDGHHAWTKKPLIIKIEFTGYDEESNPTYIRPATRWIPVRMVKCNFGVSGSGTEYTLEFVATAVVSKSPLRTAMNMKTLTCGTVQDFCTELATSWNASEKYKTETHTEMVETEEFQEDNDEYITIKQNPGYS